MEEGAGEAILDGVESRYATVDDVRVHYKLIGEGTRTTVLVHGGGCDLTFWELQLPALLNIGRVLLLDLPGHGLSDKPEDLRYSMKLHARAINAVVEDAKVDRAIVVGHSLGVPALREFYRGWPEKVAGFIAVDGILIYEDPGWSSAAIAWLMDTWLYDYVWPPIVDSFTGEQTPDWGVEKVNDAMKNAPPHVVRSFLPEMSDPETAYNDRIDVPLLAVYAENPLWTDEVQAEVRAFNDRAEVLIMPGVSHFLMLDRPDEFNRLLTDFILKSWNPSP